MYKYLHPSASVNMAAHTHTHIEDEALEHKVKTDQFIDEYCYYRSNGRHCVLHGCDCMLICRTSSSTRQLQTSVVQEMDRIEPQPLCLVTNCPPDSICLHNPMNQKMLFIFREFFVPWEFEMLKLFACRNAT